MELWPILYFAAEVPCSGVVTYERYPGYELTVRW